MNAASVADLACGTGYAATILTNGNEANYIGVDIDARAIDYASRRHGGERRSFLCASATSTPIDDASIDLVASFETIEHVEDTAGLVTEYARVLSKRGILVVSTPNKLGYTEHHVHDFSGDDLVAALSERFDVLRVIGQLANDSTYEPDLPPGMWHLDDSDAQGRRPDYTIVIARLRGSTRPMLTSSNSSDMQRVRTKHGTIPFFCPTDTVRWRAQTLLTKEPDTIEWIDLFDQGDVFWDIGASTGPYTMYAAAAGRASQIISLEPSPWNWWVLAEQVRRCRMEQLVRTLPIAAGDQLCVNDLHMRHPFPGGAGSSFGQPIGELGETFQPQHSQSAIGMPVDHLIQQLGLPIPNRMKIDVDGNEHAVLRGATRTLQSSSLRSVLIELDSERSGLIEPVTRLMQDSGLTLVSRGVPGTDPGTLNSSIRNYRFERA
jgi:FkbM family methyltransferase